MKKLKISDDYKRHLIKFFLFFFVCPFLLVSVICAVRGIYRVPTVSMQPTFRKGSFISVMNKNVMRGDIVVFKSKELKKTLVKRVLGIPGDTLQIRAGHVIRNGKEISEKYVKYWGGKSGSFKVPKDHYFLLGDNRSDSLDSRYWENPYILKSLIIGVVRK